MKTWALILTLALGAASAAEELIPGQPQAVCRLVRTDTEFVLTVGDREVKRFAHSHGANFVEARPIHDRALLTALETLEALRRSGACK